MSSSPSRRAWFSVLCLVAACGGGAEPSAERGAAASAPPVESGELSVGAAAPDFSARDQQGKPVSLSALRGKQVVLYFYPKDETPGCTAEAQAFRDAHEKLTQHGVAVIGVSTDSDESHRAFAANHSLPFTLVSDASETLAAKYGVPVRMGFSARQTFVIDAQGKLARIYRDVDVATHVAQILGDVTPAATTK